jgi:hypothetical protein
MQPGSPEYLIADKSNVKTTSGEVFELPSENTFGLPQETSSYIAIPLAKKGQVTVQVVNEEGMKDVIAWELGTMIYLSGTVGLKCCGNGSVTCIMLALNHEDEE